MKKAEHPTSNAERRSEANPRRCQWMAGVMAANTSAWVHCKNEAVAEVFRDEISVGCVCYSHELDAQTLGWQTKHPIRTGIPNV